ncbi:MAG: DnaB-like helicase C-terminal domain-containing protein, partial [Candidatus Omnitrophica bacterium]|nr:DnaB-like helicase C-terminal domain-containing protein [Candidatus Omnitrophota bacterium]
LQLMRGAGQENRQQEISDISRSLKALARELSLPVVAISQLSRAVESRTDHRPQLSDLRESGAIEQDADVVVLLLREEYYNPTPENEGLAEVIIAKQRNGPVGSAFVTFLKEYTRFENLARPRTE